MKRVIEGRRYDTEAPQTTEIATAESDVGKSDFRWYYETLYRTGRGRWFLVGEGGPMSRWARRLDDGCRTEGKGLQPLTDTDALRWLENGNELDAIEQYFGDEVQDA